MRQRRLLLATTALSTAALTFGEACGKTTAPDAGDNGVITNPLPGNPKGMSYDAGVPPDTTPPSIDASVEQPPIVDASIDRQPMGDASVRKRIPYPANPKGTRYDRGFDDDLPKKKQQQ